MSESPSAAPNEQDTELAEERRATDQFWKSGFRMMYESEHGEEPSAALQDRAFEYGLIVCEALDAGKPIDDIYRLAGSSMSTDEARDFPSIVITSIRQTCPEHEAALGDS